MGSFGNDVGALFGGSMYGSKANNWSNEEWNALMGRDKPESYRDQTNPGHIDELSNGSAPEDADKFDLSRYESQLGTTPGLIPDQTVHDEITGKLTGGNALNWEDFTFGELRGEKDSLNPGALQTLSTAWTNHGNTLKTSSEDFKESVQKLISGKWSGESAGAAEQASHHVTENSIYDFTPASDALSDRLAVLKAAFEDIRSRFPDGRDTIEKFDTYDKTMLDHEVQEFNTKFHFSSEGHLLLSDGRYVDVSSAIAERNRIQQSINDYHEAVQLFRDSYEPTVAAVTQNFPTLPPPPNLKFQPAGPPGPGPTHPGGGPGLGGGGGPGLGGGGMPKIGGGGMPKIGTPDFSTAGFEPPEISGLDTDGIGTTDPSKLPGISDPQASLPSTIGSTPAKGLGSAVDAASQGLNSALGQATKAAQSAAGAGQKPFAPSLREGALGLGKPGDAKGVGGGAGKGVGGGGAAGGGLGVNEPSARLSSQPTMATGARGAVPAASSAMGGGVGAPGMGGAPAGGGQRGADGKEHKTNKVLKSRKNGSEITGETGAVVPVLGADPTPPPEENQPAPTRRRIPGRGNSWQPDSATPGGPSQSTQPQYPAPATSDQ
ncbi:hypothetical protein [Mycobacterium deserti]|uniref:ESX-1 secretion-associated protein EspA/EspE-like domain-containing protein n=1 Tax=Mycobacterium deserti TaxID=2978347 RepID=A0ABT2MF08_9MYCO|nr:hypothetical protein [Mycobacterium deserti]MCT7659700.1 hypothetical protein [Mycobacterium deserti]